MNDTASARHAPALANIQCGQGALELESDAALQHATDPAPVRQRRWFARQLSPSQVPVPISSHENDGKSPGTYYGMSCSRAMAAICSEGVMPPHRAGLMLKIVQLPADADPLDQLRRGISARPARHRERAAPPPPCSQWGRGHGSTWH